jgi:formate dehydrogenase major subunit
VASFPNKNKVVESLSKLKFLVTIDPLNTETSTFWQNHGESNDVDPSKIQTEVFRLPSTCFAEENGSIVNSGRWLQWHWKGADAPGIAMNDGEILAGIFLRLRKMYAAEGGANPEPVLNMTWNYSTPENLRRKKWRWRATVRRWRMLSTRPPAPCWRRKAISSAPSPPAR